MEINKDAIKIIVVDDEANIRREVQLSLQNDGYRVHPYESPVTAYQQIATQDYDLAILDIKMDGVAGLELFQRMVENGIPTPVIFISGNASVTEAIQAVKLRAFDFLEKPFTSEKLCITVQRCLEHQDLKRKVEVLQAQDANAGRTHFVCQSKATERLLQEVTKVAKSNATVLLEGESGTGKELLAKLIHEQSERKNKPFIKVNCSAIPETLIESELFGFEKGAFTGAAFAKRGFFEQANHGTLFLDEIGDMSLGAQAKVLRAIQSAEIQKLGSERVISVNIRIVAATNKDLKAEVEAGRFREDLYYRISVVPLHSVPLRERPEDIPLLVVWFAQRACTQNGFKEKVIGEDVLSELRKYSWPGNVRELQNLVERIVIMSGDQIGKADLPAYLFDNAVPAANDYAGLSLKDFKDRSERDYLVSVLKITDGNISKASEMLQIERTYLHKKIQQHEIQKREYFV
ncbi:sigma-54 dependent transcriptional regulator [Bdellovibrionota bacterium FG-2]